MVCNTTGLFQTAFLLLATRLQDTEAADVRQCSLRALSGLQHGSIQEHYL